MRLLAVGWKLALCGLIVLALSPSAAAHAMYRSSDPADGEQLQEPPDAATITFTEAPELSLSSIRVLDSSGRSWDQGDVRAVEGDPLSVAVSLRPLPDGVYTVNWRVVSTVDGHATAGAFAFGVGAQVQDIPQGPAQEPEPPPVSLQEIAGRCAFLAGLVIAVGGTSLSAMVPGQWSRSVRRLVYGGLALTAVGLLLLGAAQRHAAGVTTGELVTTSIGTALIGRLVTLGGAAMCVVGAARLEATKRRLALGVGAVIAAGAMLVHVSAGHAAAAGSWAPVNVAAQCIHFVAAGVWLGGLAALLLATRGATDDDKATLVRRFSFLAGIMLFLVAGTGLLRAFNELPTWSSLWSSGYGRLVVLKMVLFVGLATLGGINRYRNVPRSATTLTGLRRVSRIELGLAAATLVAAGALSSIAPPAEDRAAAAEAHPLEVSGADFGTSVRARLQIDPGFAGPNHFLLSVTDYDSGAPIGARRVSLAFRYLDRPGVAESVLELEPTEQELYEGHGTNLSLEGRWEITALIQRGADSVEVPLEIATRCRAEEMQDPGRASIFTLDVGDGGSLQAYADPGTAGHNEIHLTFFGPEGTELEVERKPRVTASRAGEEAMEVSVERFGPGHFVGGAHLGGGEWRFDLSGRIEGLRFTGCFEQRIAP